MTTTDGYDQYFLSYSGISLPLNLVSPITPEALRNRNTYFGAKLDDRGRLVLIHKLVYGTVELSHRYGYAENGKLSWAEIQGTDEDGRKLYFDDSGRVIAEEDLETD